MRQVDRRQCIADLRKAFVRLVDDDHSLCEVAARRGIFCRGFAQWTFEELKQRYSWLAASRPGITRERLEQLANLWQLARQQVFNTRLPCDTETIEHDACLGFDGFTDADLSRFHSELCGEPVVVTRSADPTDDEDAAAPLDAARTDTKGTPHPADSADPNRPSPPPLSPE